MIGKYRFYQGAYDRADALGKEVLATYLQAHQDYSNLAVVIPEENRGPDVEVYNDIGVLLEYHEVEYAGRWRDHPFKYKTIHIPERKGRLVKMAYEKEIPVFFWTISQDKEWAFRTPHTVVTDDLLKEVPNRRIPSGEYFFDIPLNLVELVQLN